MEFKSKILLFQYSFDILDYLFNHLHCFLACNVLLTNSSGTITSPLYPAYYPNESICKWTISVPKGNIIILSSLIFGLEPHLRCKKDYLAVYDGTPYASSMIGRYCGEDFPSRIESSSHIMGLVFRSDGHVTRKGFRFTYETKGKPTFLPKIIS